MLKIAIEQMKVMHRANYNDAISYMSTTAVEINSAIKPITGNPCQISQGTISNNTVSMRNHYGELIIHLLPRR